MSGDARRPGVDWEAAYVYLQEQQESILLRLAERLEAQEARLGAAREAQVRAVELYALDTGHLRSVIVADGASLSYAFHVFRDGLLVREQAFGVSNTLQWQPAEAGSYRVTGLVRSRPADGVAPRTADSTAVTVTSRAGAGR